MKLDTHGLPAWSETSIWNDIFDSQMVWPVSSECLTYDRVFLVAHRCVGAQRLKKRGRLQENYQ